MPAADSQWSAAFAGADVAAMRVYDTILARLFTPWAHDLIARLAPTPGSTALDIACGPGTVAHHLAARLGPTGRVIAADISPAMLAIARAKPIAEQAAPIEWLQSPAAPIPLPSSSVDLITCQQGLQFFPDKPGALTEMRRLLRPGARAGIAIWTRVEDQIFQYLHAALATLSPDLASRYLGPFLLSGDEAAAHARTAGFTSIDLSRITLPALLPDGAQSLFDTLAAAGIAPDIAALPDSDRAALLSELTRLTAPLTTDGTLHSSLTASVLLLS